MNKSTPILEIKNLKASFNDNEILYGKSEFKNTSLIVRNKNIL